VTDGALVPNLFEKGSSRDRQPDERRFEQIIGASPALESVLEQVERVAPTQATVLIEGGIGPQPHSGFIEVSS
jgi:transcriptional regulator with GAF, ATPase, and Fis domain